MKISLNNVGKVKSSSIEITGITIIAGENNTGKSTVGKTLFSIFNSFYNIMEKVYEEKKDSIENLLDLYIRNNFEDKYKIMEIDQLVTNIFKTIDNLGESSKIEEYLLDFFMEYETNTDFKIVGDKINEILNISDDEYIKTVLQKKLNVEFNNQINNVYVEEEANIVLDIKGKKIQININDNEIISVSDKMNIINEAIYIDDPHILDNQRRYFFFGNVETGHKDHLTKLLYYTNKKENIIDEIVTKNKFDKIIEKINKICDGNIVRNKQRSYGYQINGSEKIIDLKNISTGLKTFAILKKLLIENKLENNCTIILDEPEIHLHPEWQLLFAELIVMMQKEFNMHILLTTHSPYFLRAIQVYSSKHEIANKCKYYLSENKDNFSNIIDVSTNIDLIYQKLANPLQELEDEEWANV